MMLLVTLVAGFGVSFIVLDVSRLAGRRHWPSAEASMADNFRPFAVFLALFAGPALFVQSVWRAGADRRLSILDGFLAVTIALGWAVCYGIVVVKAVHGSGLAVL